jgi:hypothetical protein
MATRFGASYRGAAPVTGILCSRHDFVCCPALHQTSATILPCATKVSTTRLKTGERRSDNKCVGEPEFHGGLTPVGAMPSSLVATVAMTRGGNN